MDNYRGQQYWQTEKGWYYRDTCIGHDIGPFPTADDIMKSIDELNKAWVATMRGINGN